MHHALYLANTDNCTMAALSSKLLDLALPKKVTVNYFSGDVIKEWSIEMGQEEEPLHHPLHRLPHLTLSLTRAPQLLLISPNS